MRIAGRKIAILLALAAVTALAQLNWAALKPFQTSPVAVGARLNAGWLLPNTRPNWTLTGEVLFPVAGAFRVRASVIDIVVTGTTLDSLFANSNLSFDAVASMRLGRSRLWPYAWLGPELGGKLDALRLSGRAGVGVEGLVQRGLALFGEAGLAVGTPVSGVGSTTLRVRVGAGARLGGFVR
jgi:hypothetical protein